MKVIGVDGAGKGIAVKAMIGDKELVAGAIVTDGTEIKAQGKEAALKEIKPGDTVTLFYALEKDDLYAKKVIKK